MSRELLLARLDAVARNLQNAPREPKPSTRGDARPRPKRPRPRFDGLVEASAAVNRVKSAEATVAAIRRITEREALDRFRLGGLLCKLRDRRWHCGFSSFTRMVERHLGIRKSTAYKAIRVYETLMDLGIDWAGIADLGVAKLSLLCAKFASGELPRHDFAARAAGARAMSFRELAASFPRRRPPYLLKSRPERGEEQVKMWMVVNGAERVLGWFARAFPSWRPEDAAAVIARARERDAAVPSPMSAA